MRFLIDECLSIELVHIANQAGFEAHHVSRVGRRSEKDWKLVAFVIENDFVMVTRNSKDFRGDGTTPGFLTKEEVHPGLVSLNAERMNRKVMADLFAEALQFLTDAAVSDLVNQVLEVDCDRLGQFEVRLYESPRR
jgi:predicted nuclease of predicted toxin-antitoxin system